MTQRIVGAAAIALCATFAAASDFYVSPTAAGTGNGTLGNPWRLQTALDQPSAVQPGDTIWLRGGTYPGRYTSKLAGTATYPIIVRQYPGERATIDGGNSGGLPIFFVKGAYTWYWGFEVMSSNTDRVASVPGPGPSGTEVPRGEGIVIEQSSPHDGLKFINLIVHDTRQGFSFWDEAINSEIYGCVVYYNGWSGPDDGHGHGIYGQNQASNTKKVTDSIVFSNFGEGLQFYASSVYVNNITLTGNTLLQNGLGDDYTRNVLVGGDNPAQNPKLIGNYLYYGPGGPATGLKLGLSGSNCQSPVLSGNYIANSVQTFCNSMTIDGNTFYGSIQGFTQSQFPNNVYHSSRPTGAKVFIRSNQYEAGRATITVFNWDSLPSVDVDLSAVLTVGQAFEIRNGQDILGAPVASGTYDGSAVALATMLAPATPVGWPAPTATGPDFNVYVLIGAPGPYEFLDVFPSSLFHDDIVTLAANGITTGCGNGRFCPAALVTRAQMAVLLLKAKHGSDYLPPPASGSVFGDVPAGAFAADWIEACAVEGITAGCQPDLFCPNSPVNRAQAAVLLVRAMNEPGFSPPPAAGVFDDVPPESFAAAWIEELSREGVTAGCAPDLFCPTSWVTRGQVATLLVRGFGLQ